MEVKLINWTPEPERTVALAARLCYSSVGVEDLNANFTKEDEARFLDKLISLGHLSPLEHVSFTFAAEGVSRALTHQLVRHRIASYSQQSQRYVREDDFEFIVPPSIQRKPETLALFHRTMAQINEAYKTLAELVPKEDARYVLPQACETKIVFTFNARSLLNFFQHRLCTRAQWEIRQLAGLMLQEVRRQAPVLFAKAGATCETEGVCYEGELSCGRVSVVKKRSSGEDEVKAGIPRPGV
ncbi:MAG: FAD-dependent thymidylate synthase [Clostridia bacterium]|nr:FAD-dependent thymidylate synthase [Clostridia bacterium]